MKKYIEILLDYANNKQNFVTHSSVYVGLASVCSVGLLWIWVGDMGERYGDIRIKLQEIIILVGETFPRLLLVLSLELYCLLLSTGQRLG